MREGTEGTTVQLSLRLKALAELVTPGARVADVGCDHGFLSIYLVQEGICPGAIAMDLREGPLSRAKAHIAENGLETYIETRVSDGLQKLSPGEADTMVCAGMGGRLMRRILTDGETVAKSFRELVLQPQSQIREFRAFLREQGYGICREEMVLEDEKFYVLIKAVPGTAARSVPEGIPVLLADKYGGCLLAGKHPLLLVYLKRERELYQRILERIALQGRMGERTAERERTLLSELADLDEAIGRYGERGESNDYSDN